MSDIQILTLALTVVVPFFGVMLGVLLNNTRLNDLKELLRGEIRAEGAELTLLMQKHHSENPRISSVINCGASLSAVTGSSVQQA